MLHIVYNILAGHNHYHEEGVSGIYQQVNSTVENIGCPHIIGPFINYIRTTLKFRKLDYLETLAKRQRTEIYYPDVYEAVEPNGANYEDTYWEKGFGADVFEHDGLREAFAQLSTKNQAILAKTYLQQLTDAEIAVKIDTTPGYVKNARHRAIKKLKQLLRGDT